ncbi:hypothetical protein BD779DRAFT_1538983 [Infundibulicybe gibba]|nr:hypothetical protein BD779DRAFT_1538983 [Infundibulicybe gibba]
MLFAMMATLSPVLGFSATSTPIPLFASGSILDSASISYISQALVEPAHECHLGHLRDTCQSILSPSCRILPCAELRP